MASVLHLGETFAVQVVCAGLPFETRDLPLCKILRIKQYWLQDLFQDLFIVSLDIPIRFKRWVGRVYRTKLVSREENLRTQARCKVWNVPQLEGCPWSGCACHEGVMALQRRAVLFINWLLFLNKLSSFCLFAGGLVFLMTRLKSRMHTKIYKCPMAFFLCWDVEHDVCVLEESKV